jgi:hypothetical protein
MDGIAKDIEEFHMHLTKRFECKPIQYLKVDEPLDYLGTEMAAYTKKRRQHTPRTWWSS